ncbi:MAG: bacteriophage abortive infection AbiH family protein [Desulfuromonadaceae bacterium]|nr:bacteriophage abortive infection AbiH family protein [Desulfuromonadaceae bacterium]
MNSSTLYIIGNGFDIYHGIESRYSSFKNYFHVHDRDSHDRVEEYLQVHEDWSDLEIALAYLDIGTVLDHASDFLQSYATEKWSDAYHHDYQFEINNIVSSLSSKLKSEFCDWLRQLTIPYFNELNCTPLKLNNAGTFFNFNYTPSLEHIYGIPKENIFYIHGKIGDPNTEIILGHAWNPADIPDLNDVPDPEDMDTRVMEGNEILNDYFKKTFKQTDQIIKQNKQFFDSLKSISEIRILGHSLSEVDFKYIEVISKVVMPNCSWKISYYNNNEINNHRSVMERLNVKNQEYCTLQNI